MLTAKFRKVRLAGGELPLADTASSAARLSNLLQICSRAHRRDGDHAGKAGQGVVVPAPVSASPGEGPRGPRPLVSLPRLRLLRPAT
jgi:hypothetical protein